MHGSQSQRLVRPGSQLFKWATTVLMRSADGLLLLSREEQREFQSFSPHVPVEVVRNPRPVLPEVETDTRAQLPIILCVSRLIVEKGILDLVSVLPGVARENPCRLVLAGEGPDAGRVHALAAALGVHDLVELPGYLDDAELARLYSAADIFALPTSWHEGFPTVILEAMGVGLPIVTTPSRGQADHLVEGQNVLFVRSGDREALSGALARLLADPELRRRMSLANREKVREFDANPVAEEYLAALDQIVAATRHLRRSRRRRRANAGPRSRPTDT